MPAPPEDMPRTPPPGPTQQGAATRTLDAYAPVVVIGAGPSGLMAAEVLAAADLRVEVWDRKPSAARKFLLAGVGGLNLTHVDALDSSPDGPLPARFGPAADWLMPALQAFDGNAIRAWAGSLGVDTFVGSSGRIFPTDMKAAPLLRHWIARLKASGVVFRMRRHWTGWTGDGLLRHGDSQAEPARAVVLALGGASWPQLGSDGGWVPLLAARGASIAPLLPANCGFDVGWSPRFAERHAGAPVKSVCLSLDDGAGEADGAGEIDRRAGEFVVTATGIEGSLVYTFAARLRDRLAAGRPARLWLDLHPARDVDTIAARLAKLPTNRTLAWRLRSAAAIDGVKAALLRECAGTDLPREPKALASLLKALPLLVCAPRPIAEAISTAGGVRRESLDARFMLRTAPGVFCAGEMLDWEAPTGGYLLSASLATGRACGHGLIEWLASREGT